VRLPGLGLLAAAAALALLGGCRGAATGTSAASASEAAIRSSRPVSPNVQREIQVAPDLRLRQIGEDAYVVTSTLRWEDGPIDANSVLVEMADGTYVLAGTPWSPEATDLLLDWLRDQSGGSLPPMVAIDTGYHIDNLGGNAALLRAGIPVYGSDLTVSLLEERGEAGLVPPDHVFPISQGLSLSFGGEHVTGIYPGPSQAPDKLAVYFPERRLLFGSCMILGGDLGNTADADLAAWPDAIRRLLPLPVDVVVPGHGERLDPGLLQHTLDVLAEAA
jgi:metallo-beta-lactamase class B